MSRWSLRGAQVGVLLDSLWNLRLQLQSAFMHAALSSVFLNFTVGPECHWLVIVIVNILDSVLKMLFTKATSRGEGHHSAVSTQVQPFVFSEWMKFYSQSISISFSLVGIEWQPNPNRELLGKQLTRGYCRVHFNSKCQQIEQQLWTNAKVKRDDEREGWKLFTSGMRERNETVILNSATTEEKQDWVVVQKVHAFVTSEFDTPK